MIEVVRYTSEKKLEWDDFVMSSDLQVFMFCRDYLEYHNDRFDDFSLMVFDSNKLVCLLPGHLIEGHFKSHFGLTFGGYIHAMNTSYEYLLCVFNVVKSFLIHNKVSKVSVKLPPSFYSMTYNQCQTYLHQRNIDHFSNLKLSTCIHTKSHQFLKSSIEKRKLKLDSFDFNFCDDYDEFWPILENNLKDFHGTKPVHTLQEIKRLRTLFPCGIKLYVARNKETGEIDAGVVLYVFNNVMKLQYQAASAVGRTNRASHALYYKFIAAYLDKVDYIDLGSCMDDVDVVNTNLVYIKERFGAKIYSMLSYEYDVNVEFK